MPKTQDMSNNNEGKEIIASTVVCSLKAALRFRIESIKLNKSPREWRKLLTCWPGVLVAVEQNKAIQALIKNLKFESFGQKSDSIFFGFQSVRLGKNEQNNTVLVRHTFIQTHDSPCYFGAILFLYILVLFPIDRVHRVVHETGRRAIFSAGSPPRG